MRDDEGNLAHGTCAGTPMPPDVVNAYVEFILNASMGSTEAEVAATLLKNPQIKAAYDKHRN